MGSIVLLDDLTINKIAAGEVIERPASVIKELVENSVDAGATNITVEIRNGGISYIRITDNGKGIMPDDMEIAFERHATSKIRVADDLQTVKSMGFRGEALASIAAISRVKMQSKTMDEETGYEVIVEGGKLISKEEVGCQNGTIIEVENLFYNTPVRYKFLKKDFTESGYIEDAITRIALAHPEIAIKLINTGKTVIQTTGNGEMKSAIYSIYGKDITENVIDVDFEYEDIKITGVIGKPEIARSNRSSQIFFVNNRYVKDKTLTSAAEQAYKEKLQQGKYGFLVLNIEIDPASIDVNVHPAKLEIRFSDEQKVFKAVYHAIKDEIMKNEFVPSRNELEEKNEVIQEFKTVEENKIIAQENELEQPRGFFRKIFNKREEQEEKPNMMEELYKTRKLNIEKNEEAPSFDSIMGKMAEMQKTISEFKGIPENIEKKDDNNSIEQETVTSEIEIYTQEEQNEEKAELEENKTEDNVQENVENVESEINYTQVEEQNVDTNEFEHNEIAQEVQQNNIEENTENEINYTQVEEQNVDINEFEHNEIAQEEYLNNSQENNNIENKEEFQEEQVIEDNPSNNEETKKIESVEYNNFDEAKVLVQEEKKEISFEDMYRSIFGISPKKEPMVKEEEVEYKIEQPEFTSCENITLFDNVSKKEIPNYKFIGIAFTNYIIVEIEKEIFIINQYAANEKILYKMINESFYNMNKKDSQLMLLPDIIELTSKEMDIANENAGIFQKAGFILEQFGENTIKLVGVPSYCMELNTKELFVDLLSQINKVPMNEKEQVEKKFISTLAKNVALQKDLAETKEEAEILLENLLKLENPFVCESGKQVAIEMKREDIEKKFSRR